MILIEQRVWYTFTGDDLKATGPFVLYPEGTLLEVCPKSAVPKLCLVADTPYIGLLECIIIQNYAVTTLRIRFLGDDQMTMKWDMIQSNKGPPRKTHTSPSSPVTSNA